MSDIHKNAQGKLCGTYNGIKYQFESIIELITAISIIKGTKVL